MSSTLDAFIGKMDSATRRDLSELHGTCWDEDDVILRCRNCNAEFSMMIRKHHVRSLSIRNYIIIIIIIIT
jgi:hypothetical protein